MKSSKCLMYMYEELQCGMYYAIHTNKLHPDCLCLAESAFHFNVASKRNYVMLWMTINIFSVVNFTSLLSFLPLHAYFF